MCDGAESRNIFDSQNTNIQPEQAIFAMLAPENHLDITSPFGSDGLMEDWDLLGNLLLHTLTNDLQFNSQEYALLFANPNHNRQNDANV